MARAASNIRCRARLLRPAVPKRATWTFLVLPAEASARLPTRGQTVVDGTLSGQPFRAALLEPDGQGSHWMKVPRALRDAARAEPGGEVELEIGPAEREPEPRVPAELRQALADAPDARAVWSDITPAARRDWIHWITSAKREQTRTRRIANACDMLANGKRRVCCFDRSGIYSGEFSAPQAADPHPQDANPGGERGGERKPA